MAIDPVLTYGLLFISLYFEIFLLVSFLERRFRRSAPAVFADQYIPTVAIVVPCFNEARSLGSTVESLLSLDYPKEKLEVIVVDDGSTDSTLAVARSYATEAGTSPRVIVLSKENGGKHTAMNLALAHTGAELIGCLDADSVVEPAALRVIVPSFRDPKVAAITPGIHVKAPRTILQHMQKVEYRLSIFVRFILSALGSAFITPGPFSIFRASVVRELGGWRHGHATEDMEMALRLQVEGYLIGNAPKAVVHTMTPKHLRGLLRQRVRWTYGWLRNAVDYRELVGNRAYGNLGIIILPSALISIFTALYFFFRILFSFVGDIIRDISRFLATGLLPHPTFDLFYLNTSAMWFIIFFSVVLVLLLISVGSFIGTGSRRLPISTPLFIFFYCFLAPLWLAAALMRATFKTGVRWR